MKKTKKIFSEFVTDDGILERRFKGIGSIWIPPSTEIKKEE